MIFSYKNALISYKIKGNRHKPVIAALHGFTENRNMWKALYKALKQEFYFLLPDLLGHGKSTLTGEVLTMEEQADMLKSLLDFQGIGKVNLIGHSMGGYIALAFAEMYPERTESILLLNSHPFADDPDKVEARKRSMDAARQNKRKYLAETVPGFFASYHREVFKGAIEKLVDDACKMPVEGITGALAGMMLRKDRSAMFFDSRNFRKGWIIAKDDPLIAPELFEKKAENAKDLYFKIIDGGHMSYVENKEGMIAAVLDFFGTNNFNE